MSGKPFDKYLMDEVERLAKRFKQMQKTESIEDMLETFKTMEVDGLVTLCQQRNYNPRVYVTKYYKLIAADDRY